MQSQAPTSFDRNLTLETYALAFVVGLLGGMVIPVMGFGLVARQASFPGTIAMMFALLVPAPIMCRLVEDRIRAREIERSAKHGLLFALGWILAMVGGFFLVRLLVLGR